MSFPAATPSVAFSHWGREKKEKEKARKKEGNCDEGGLGTLVLVLRLVGSSTYHRNQKERGKGLQRKERGGGGGKEKMQGG